jgi:hypothetical protein
MSVQILRVSPLSSWAFILRYDTAEERCEETPIGDRYGGRSCEFATRTRWHCIMAQSRAASARARRQRSSNCGSFGIAKLPRLLIRSATLHTASMAPIISCLPTTTSSSRHSSCAVDQGWVGLFENAEQRQPGLGRHNVRDEGDEVIVAIAKTVAELTCRQDGQIRQQLIGQLLREIMNYDAEFRRDDATGVSSSHARH